MMLLLNGMIPLIIVIGGLINIAIGAFIAGKLYSIPIEYKPKYCSGWKLFKIMVIYDLYIILKCIILLTILT